MLQAGGERRPELRHGVVGRRLCERSLLQPAVDPALRCRNRRRAAGVPRRGDDRAVARRQTETARGPKASRQWVASLELDPRYPSSASHRMGKMGKCAICHRTDVQYTVEHVIPEALGGCYRRKAMVCVDCNSELGRRVDHALVNHGLSKMFRFVHGLRGKAKTAPNPFAGEFRLRSDPTRKMRIEIGSGGHLIPYFIPDVRREELDGGRVGVNLSVDSTDERKIEPMVRKIADRLGGSAEEALAGAEKTVPHRHPALERWRTGRASLSNACLMPGWDLDGSGAMANWPGN